MVRVQIAGVFLPGQSMRVCVIQQLTARNLQQGAPVLAGCERAQRPHRRQPIRAGASQGTQQESFRLVIAVVGGDQYVACLHLLFECGIACLACGGFQAITGIALYFHAGDDQRNADRLAKFTAMFRPAIRIRVQAMMDMHGAQSLLDQSWIAGQRMQQHTGIQSATQPHQQWRFRGLIQFLFQSGRVRCTHAYMLAGAGDSGTELLHAR